MPGSTDKVLKDLVEAKYKLTLSFEEGEIGEMDSSSESGSERGTDHEQTIKMLMEEIEEMKLRLEESEKKCFAAEKLFELKQKDDGDLKLNEENKRVKEQLKWKMEQFEHLEEAHEKLKNEYQKSSRGWEAARSVLVDEVSELKKRLESESRISNDLRIKLEMCSQALAHEESKIKTLEAELAESKVFYEKAFTECQEVKSELENLMLCRDEEIANLKILLAEKEAMCKEYEYVSRKIEQENHELMTSLKELQEAQIQGGSYASSSTLARVKSKLKNVEQKHKAREAEWSSKLEKLADELNCCRSELEIKDATIKEMSSRLEDLEMTHMNCSSCPDIKDDQLIKLEKLSGELNCCRSELEVKDATIREMSSRLEGLEKAHMNCSTYPDIKDDKLDSRFMVEEPSNCMSELETKDFIVTELKLELEECHSSLLQLKVENEEISLMLSAYQKGFAELQTKMESEKAGTKKVDDEREERIIDLMRQLDEANKDLARMQRELQEDHNLKEQSLKGETNLKMQRDAPQEDLEMQQELLMEISKERHLKEQRFDKESYLIEQREALQAELERHQVMVMEMSENERYLKEQCLEIECDLKERLQEVCDALDSTHAELVEASCKESEIEFEKRSWKALAEKLQLSLEECQQMRKQVEHSLLEEVENEEKLKYELDSASRMLEEKEMIIIDLQKQIASLGVQSKTIEASRALPYAEKCKFLSTAKEKDRILEDIQNELESLQDDVRREAESSGDEKSESEEDIIQFIQNKVQRIEHLMERLDSLEENFDNSLNSFSVELEEKEAHISWIMEAWEKIATAEKLAKLEIEEKEQMVAELEDEIHDIERKLETQETSFRQMENQALDIEDVLETKQIEMKKLTSQMRKKLNDSDALINELRSEKMALYQDVMKLSTERENLMDYIGELCDRINEFSNEDMLMMGMLGNIMQNFDDQGPQLESTGSDDGKFNVLKENQNSNISPIIKRFEVLSNERSPFREINAQLHLGASS